MKCRGKHEYYSCGGACDNVCKTLHIQNQTHCPIINIQCNRMCYCEKGYARDENNICIPIEKCPSTLNLSLVPYLKKCNFKLFLKMFYLLQNQNAPNMKDLWNVHRLYVLHKTVHNWASPSIVQTTQTVVVQNLRAVFVNPTT